MKLRLGRLWYKFSSVRKVQEPGWPRILSASLCVAEANGSMVLFDTNTDLKEGD